MAFKKDKDPELSLATLERWYHTTSFVFCGSSTKHFLKTSSNHFYLNFIS